MNVISNSMFDRMVPSFLEKQTESFLAESEQETALAFDEKVYNDKDTIQGLVKHIGDDFKTLINPTGRAGGKGREIADLIPNYNGTDLPYLGPFQLSVEDGGPRMYDAMFSIGVRAYKLYWEAQIKNEFPSANQTTIRQKHWSALIGRHDAHDLGFQNSASASVRKPFFSVNRFLRYLNAGNLIQGAQIAGNQKDLEFYYHFISSDEPAGHVEDTFWYNKKSRYFLPWYIDLSQGVVRLLGLHPSWSLSAFQGGFGDPGADPKVDTQKKRTMQRLLMAGHNKTATPTSLSEEAVRSFQLGILPMNVFLCGLAHMGAKGFFANTMFSDFYGPHGIVDKNAFSERKFQNRASTMWFHRWLNNDHNHKDSPCDPSRSSDEGYMVDGFCQMSTEKSAMRKGHASYDLHSLLQNVLDAEPFPDAMRLPSASPAGIDLHNKIYYDVHCWAGPNQYQRIYCGAGALCAFLFVLYCCHCCTNWLFVFRLHCCPLCITSPDTDSGYPSMPGPSPTLFCIGQFMMMIGHGNAFSTNKTPGQGWSCCDMMCQPGMPAMLCFYMWRFLALPAVGFWAVQILKDSDINKVAFFAGYLVLYGVIFHGCLYVGYKLYGGNCNESIIQPIARFFMRLDAPFCCATFCCLGPSAYLSLRTSNKDLAKFRYSHQQGFHWFYSCLCCFSFWQSLVREIEMEGHLECLEGLRLPWCRSYWEDDDTRTYNASIGPQDFDSCEKVTKKLIHGGCLHNCEDISCPWCPEDRRKAVAKDLHSSLVTRFIGASGVIPVCCLPPIKAKSPNSLADPVVLNFLGEVDGDDIFEWNAIQKDVSNFHPASVSIPDSPVCNTECGNCGCLGLLGYCFYNPFSKPLVDRVTVIVLICCACDNNARNKKGFGVLPEDEPIRSAKLCCFQFLFEIGAGFILVFFMLWGILTHSPDLSFGYNNGCDRAGYSLYILDENADLYVYILQRGSDSFHDWEANTAMREGVFSLIFYGFFHSFFDAIPLAGSLYDKIHGAGSSRPFLEVYGGVADYYKNSQTHGWIENTVLNAVRSINNIRHKRHAGKSPSGSKTAGFKTFYNVAGHSLGGALAELASFHLQIAKRHDAETKTKEQDHFILPPGPTSLFAFSAPAIFSSKAHHSSWLLHGLFTGAILPALSLTKRGYAIDWLTENDLLPENIFRMHNEGDAFATMEKIKHIDLTFAKDDDYDAERTFEKAKSTKSFLQPRLKGRSAEVAKESFDKPSASSATQFGTQEGFPEEISEPRSGSNSTQIEVVSDTVTKSGSVSHTEVASVSKFYFPIHYPTMYLGEGLSSSLLRDYHMNYNLGYRYLKDPRLQIGIRTNAAHYHLWMACLGWEYMANALLPKSSPPSTPLLPTNTTTAANRGKVYESFLCHQKPSHGHEPAFAFIWRLFATSHPQLEGTENLGTSDSFDHLIVNSWGTLTINPTKFYSQSELAKQDSELEDRYRAVKGLKKEMQQLGAIAPSESETNGQVGGESEHRQQLVGQTDGRQQQAGQTEGHQADDELKVSYGRHTATDFLVDDANEGQARNIALDQDQAYQTQHRVFVKQPVDGCQSGEC